MSFNSLEETVARLSNRVFELEGETEDLNIMADAHMTMINDLEMTVAYLMEKLNLGESTKDYVEFLARNNEG